MLNRRQLIRSTSRLMTGLFAVQLFAAGFCMMVPQAHAVPMAAKADHHVMAVATDHCATPAHKAQDAGMERTSRDHPACSHCHQPDELLHHFQSTLDYDQSFIVLAVTQQSQLYSHQGSTRYVLVPTGPPDSSSLLYRTTQRIRI